MARVTSLPVDMQSWLQQGGKVYFVWGHSSTDGEKIIGYVRAHDRKYAARVAKANGGSLGRRANVTDITGLLQLGRPELQMMPAGVRGAVGTPLRGNPFDGSKRQTMPAVRRSGIGQSKDGVNYYATRADAEKIRDTLVPEYPHTRVVQFDFGYAVQYDKSGSYYPSDPIRSRFVKKNPPLVVFGNPGRGRGRILSRRAISIRYVHVTDGQRYEHKFGKDDVIECLPDGTFRIYNARGRRLWKDFR